MSSKKNSKSSKQQTLFSDEEVAILNSKKALKKLFAQEIPNPTQVLNELKYEAHLAELQEALVHLQSKVIKEKKKVVVVFEGRDAAGKGGAIRTITEHINPRHYRAIALDKPSVEEQGQWYLQRYAKLLPNPGEMVFFDRSWYNRAMVEPVNGFCTTKEYEEFMRQVNPFEEMLVHSDTALIKFYFAISKDEQKRRFELMGKSELTRWKKTKVDEKAQKLWDEYTKYEEKMLEQTNTISAPWTIIDANDSSKAYLAALEHILKTLN
jgi:polyphosphate kinase 2